MGSNPFPSWQSVDNKVFRLWEPKRGPNSVELVLFAASYLT